MDKNPENDRSAASGSGRRDVLKALVGAPVVAAIAAPAAAQPVTPAAPAAGPPGLPFAAMHGQPPADYFKPRAYPEHLVELGEIRMNYVVAGSPSKPALLIIPAQSESWWGYEKAIQLLEKDFQVYAVDLRGQGRSTWTPKRYSLDNMGNDLVRFIDIVIKRPVITSGCSSGAVLSCWMSAYAKPGQVRASHYEDPPLFSSEFNPLYGPSIRQTVAGPALERFATYLGDQWSVGDVKGLIMSLQSMGRNGPASLQAPGAAAGPGPGGLSGLGGSPASLREYDPEWGRAFTTGTVARTCPHELMLGAVKVPVLFTHHGRHINEQTGLLEGALTDFQAAKVRELVTAAGQPFQYVDCPDSGHTMHFNQPDRYAKILGDWAKTLRT
jgi:pimeloyl-ACP methyl ester carboxylesterase